MKILELICKRWKPEGMFLRMNLECSAYFIVGCKSKEHNISIVILVWKVNEELWKSCTKYIAMLIGKFEKNWRDFTGHGVKRQIFSLSMKVPNIFRDWKKVVGFQKFSSYSKQILVENFHTNSRSLQGLQQNFSFLIPGSGTTKAAMKDKSDSRAISLLDFLFW